MELKPTICPMVGRILEKAQWNPKRKKVRTDKTGEIENMQMNFTQTCPKTLLESNEIRTDVPETTVESAQIKPEIAEKGSGKDGEVQTEENCGFTPNRQGRI
ncbi:hypothetical protein TNIN_387651 [Trichonephila inaurata madagascariensis]|uniref:Uncharacterized protein n=1 Tax=Trichonephila inaurata madagascariensis TaxID=2747483 RepID=A0A8X6XD18_9ARAC|nr:hypothetical protein TNIN_387651 [Trichonephila inaurata madagascariensis]